MQRIRSHHHAAAEAAGRIAFALLVSLALHFALVQQVNVGTPHRAPPTPLLKVRLNVEPVPPAVLEQKRASATAQARKAELPAAPVLKFSAPAVLPVVESQRLIVEHATSPVLYLQKPVIPVPIDPVYYAARELDTYPLPLAALPEMHAADGGRVRVLAMIDETGSVSRVELFETDQNSTVAQRAVSTIQDVRFTPAQKDGLPVRSRVLIELEVQPED